MTMKKQKTLHRFAAAAAVLLAFCLVFMMPVGATGEVIEVSTWDDLQLALSTGGEVKLVGDISGLPTYSTLTIQDGVSVSLDLNGYTLSQTKQQTGWDALITNKGEFTISDSKGNGKISYTDSTVYTSDVNYGSVAILNGGKLTITGGTIESLSSENVADFGYPHAIDTGFHASKDSSLIITGGTIKNDNYTAIRIWCNSPDKMSSVEISGGTICGGVDFHDSNEKANKGELKITGGTFEPSLYSPSSPYTAALRVLHFGGDISGMKATISGADTRINGNIVYRNYCNDESTLDSVFDITGGTFTVSDSTSLKAIINSISDDGNAETRPVIQIVDSFIVDKQLEINFPVKIVGVGASKPTITCDAGKLFEVYANADFEKLNLVNNVNGGRCIDTRVGGITVNIKDCELTAAKGGNPQPLTIGGEANSELFVILSGTTINAGDAGYGIITFVPVILEIKDNSDISGYGALYFKEGSDESDVIITESKITGKNIYPEEGDNSFGVFIFERTTGVTVTLENSANVALASASGTATESIFLFKSVSGNTVNVESGIRLETVGKAVFATGTDGNTLTVEEGVISTFSIDSKYLAAIDGGKLASVATETDANGVVTKYTVQAVSAETVAPETPTATPDGDNKVISQDENPGTTIKMTGEGEVTIELPSVSDSTSSTEAKVTIVITGFTATSGNDQSNLESVTIPVDAEITANYGEIPATDSEEGTKVELSLKIADVTGSLPVIDAALDTDIKDDIEENEEHVVLAMITAINADKNANIKENDGQAIQITFKIPKTLNINPNKLGYFHVQNGVPGEFTPIPSNQIDGETDDDFYLITIYGTSFSSYVLAEAQEVKNDNVGSGSATDTGSGNYQYYPRSVPTDGIIDFGTSKVVTGMELPAGSDGTVTLNIKPTFAMPENGFYAFEIDAPGYNTDAKINGGLSFQIPVADLEAAGWTAEDIILFHGTVAEDGKIVWEALPTNLVKNENGVAYYKAAINSCSPFYIGFVKDGSVVNTEVVDPVTPETPVTPDEPEVLPPVDEPETPELPTEEPATPAPILAVLAGLGAAVVLRRK